MKLNLWGNLKNYGLIVILLFNIECNIRRKYSNIKKMIVILTPIILILIKFIIKIIDENAG